MYCESNCHILMLILWFLVPHRMRLADGEWMNSGRIELFYNGTWGTICDDGFDENDAYVVCGILGYK